MPLPATPRGCLDMQPHEGDLEGVSRINLACPVCACMLFIAMYLMKIKSVITAVSVCHEPHAQGLLLISYNSFKVPGRFVLISPYFTKVEPEAPGELPGHRC